MFCRYHCYDQMGGGLSAPEPYYESSDLIDAYHPQTILAYVSNDTTLPIANGAPIRIRIERALGYKQPKYVHTIELVDSFARFGRGNGGYWEDTATSGTAASRNDEARRGFRDGPRFFGSRGLSASQFASLGFGDSRQIQHFPADPPHAGSLGSRFLPVRTASTNRS